jgi:hypothetical protein
MLDVYSRRARLAPAALAAGPPIVLAGGSVLELERNGGIVGFLLAALLLGLCGLVRARGRSIEPLLWAQWGGPPSTAMLRWSGPVSEHTQRRRHSLLESILREALPTRAEEEGDPEGADRRYETAVAALRDLTRSRTAFPLVAEENAEYGYRRNALGLKPVALAIAAATGVAAIALAALDHAPGHFLPAAAAAAAAIATWALVVRPAWVRAAAERYAERLLETCESLDRRSTETTHRSASPATRIKEATDG